MRTDARDRFGTPLEKRFTRNQIYKMMQECGLEKIKFRNSSPFGLQLDLKKILMCGISGFYSNSSSVSSNTIMKMNAAIFHRGPDSNGFWIDKNSGIVLGHQRLSIIDLSDSGNQPMRSNSGQFILTFNGEIYNHLNIREELKKNNFNINWKGKSDTETLLEAIDCWGIEKLFKK